MTVAPKWPWHANDIVYLLHGGIGCIGGLSVPTLCNVTSNGHLANGPLATIVYYGLYKSCVADSGFRK